MDIIAQEAKERQAIVKFAIRKEKRVISILTSTLISTVVREFGHSINGCPST